MAFCQVCGKTKQYGHNVSHSKRRTKRVFMPNVFRKRVQVDGDIKRVKICSKCLKRAKKFGEVRARGEVFVGSVVRLVDWAELARKKIEVEKAKDKVKEVKKEKKKKKVEVSVEELVGKKKVA